MPQSLGLLVLVGCRLNVVQLEQTFLGKPKSTLAVHEVPSMHGTASESSNHGSSNVSSLTGVSISSMGELLTQLSDTSGLAPAAGDKACQSPDDDACLFRLLVLARAAAKKRQLIPRQPWPIRATTAGGGERKWIDRFLAASTSALTPGRCLEFGDLTYTKLHLGSQCWHQHHTTFTGRSAPPAGMTATFEVDIDHGPGPIPWSSFDTIIATQVFEHVKDPSASASALFKVLKPGGVILWTAPMSWIHHVYPGLYGDHWRFTEEGGRLLLQGAGFEILSSECHGDSSTLALYAMGMGEAEMIDPETYSGDCNYAVHVGIRAKKPLHAA
eukprot:gnl/MRDRNA2_/MRDRNA2_17178_c0_seq1.p1 gnl/MRDRNA2_/MRDRNA2_17178_c0~~gnl/MRDRNA2_/MRDRNA2_17178_c0_seq1.p1  ORF type:complete len:328 (+),score=42.27 gnl/MRDRNA2_/MRDRNA2_17178_c0_seq1:179-1162(+)